VSLIEHYVTADGADTYANSTNPATPCSLATALAGAGQGDRINVKAGAYSQGTVTMPGGTAVDPIVWRGYYSTIGDLDNLGRSAAGALVTTNMPDITITATWTPAPFCVLQNLDITGALSSALIASSTNDGWIMESCRIINTQNNAAASCVQGDDMCAAVNCDFQCTGAAHGFLLDSDNSVVIQSCRFQVVADKPCVQCQTGFINDSLFIGNAAAGTGIAVQASATVSLVLSNCTFYSLAAALTYPNAAGQNIPIVINCHATDCTVLFNNLYSATDEAYVVEYRNRTRDCGAPATRTGFVNAILAGEVTTDTGGIETDCNDAGSGDFRLISAAPGFGAGPFPAQHIGACPPPSPTIPAVANVWNGTAYGYYGALTGTKRASSIANCEAGNIKDDVVIDDVTGTYAGGGSGGLLVHPGMNGGCNG